MQQGGPTLPPPGMAAAGAPSPRPSLSGASGQQGVDFDSYLTQMKKSFEGVFAAALVILERIGPGEAGPQTSQLNLLGARMEEFESLCDEVYQIVEHTYLLMRQNALASNMGVSPDTIARAQAQDKQAYLQAIETLQQHLQASSQLRHAFLGENANGSAGSTDTSTNNSS